LTESRTENRGLSQIIPGRGNRFIFLSHTTENKSVQFFRYFRFVYEQRCNLKIEKMAKIYFSLTTLMFFFGLIFYALAPKSLEVYVSHYFGCSNPGGMAFYWQVISNRMLAIISFLMNFLFFLKKENRENKNVYGKMSNSSLVLGFLLCGLYFSYFIDGLVNMYGCNSSQWAWVGRYTLSIFEMNGFHWVLFLLIFEIIDISRRVSNAIK